MQIERMYPLPNCTLTLQGMSDASGMSALQGSQLSILINATCEILGQGAALSGGREFLTSLVSAVSRYAQEFLSGVRSRSAAGNGLVASGLVQLYPLDNGLHRLQVLPERGPTDATPAALDLTTVQLFDLVEAIDQMLADPLALPDLAISLSPISKREVPTAEPLMQRAVAPALGLSGLVLAGLAFFSMPVPEVQRTGATTGSQPNPAQTSAASPTPPPELADAANPPAITDPQQIQEIQTKLVEAIERGWVATPSFQDPLVYDVTAASDGQIMGYREVTPAAASFAQELPLADLVYTPSEGSAPSQEPLARYRVTFNPDGKLEVVPWEGAAATTTGTVPPAIEPTAAASPEVTSPEVTSPEVTPMATPDAAETVTEPEGTPTPDSATASPSPATTVAAGISAGAELQDPQVAEALVPQLYDQIDQKWTQTPTFEEPVTYRVAMTQDGKITAIEAQGEAANRALAELPLTTLTQAGTPEAPTGQFKVVFTPEGRLEVSPWDGYR